MSGIFSKLPLPYTEKVNSMEGSLTCIEENQGIEVRCAAGSHS